MFESATFSVAKGAERLSVVLSEFRRYSAEEIRNRSFGSNSSVNSSANKSHSLSISATSSFYDGNVSKRSDSIFRSSNELDSDVDSSNSTLLVPNVSPIRHNSTAGQTLLLVPGAVSRSERFPSFSLSIPSPEETHRRIASFKQLHLPRSLDPGRDSTLQQVQQLTKAREKVLDSYHRVKNAFKMLQEKYSISKENINFLQRYYAMKHMIKEVIIMEEQYWTLLEIPKQDHKESQQEYVLKIMAILDQRLQSNAPPPPNTGLSGLLGHTAKLAERAREAQMIEKLKNKSTDELKRDFVTLQSDICRLAKKYAGLRTLVLQLKNHYTVSKGYPIIPRYHMLKHMIKEVIRSKDFMEVCHEIEE